MPRHVSVRLTLPEELSKRLREYTEHTYNGQRGSLTLTVTQAVKEFLDRHLPQPVPPPVPPEKSK